MTVKQRLERLETQNQRIERKNKRLTLMAVAMCAMVTVAADEIDEGYVTFDTLFAKRILVTNDYGAVVVDLDVSKDGNGMIKAQSEKGQTLVSKASTGNGGRLEVFNVAGEPVASLGP